MIGVLIAVADSSPGWDDTGVTAALILGAAAVFGAIMPGRVVLTAVAVGIWVPAFEIWTAPNDGSLLALAMAFLGASAGAMMRKWSFGAARR